MRTARIVITVVATLGAAALSAAEARPEDPPQCVDPALSGDDQLAAAVESRQTPLSWPEKRAKEYPAPAAVPARRGLERAVTTFYSVHSREAVPVLERSPPPQEVLADLFRCRGFGERHALDPRLIDAAVTAAGHFHALKVEIVSGYRSPKFNETLAKKGRRVASESRHMRGEALDFRLTGVPAAALGAFLREDFDGGVGIYRRDDFVHIDVGPKRAWRGR